MKKFLYRLKLTFTPGVCGKHKLRHTFPLRFGYYCCAQCVWSLALKDFNNALASGVVPGPGVEFRFRQMESMINHYTQCGDLSPRVTTSLRLKSRLK